MARQLLLRRHRMSVGRVIERLVGLQAQSTEPPYIGLWSRLVGFQPDQLSRLIGERRAVRLVLMRSTIHLVTARDCLALRPVMQPALERLLRTTPFGRRLVGVDVAELVAAARPLLDEAPRTTSQLGKLLMARWPDRDAEALAQAVRTHVPLVQVPPRGVWGKGGAAVCSHAETWLGARMATDASPDATVLRYLAAFGPASARDAQSWSGLTGLDGAFERLRPRLRVFRDPDGRELHDLPRAPRPDADTPAPPRFIGEYDNVGLAHARRGHLMAHGDRPPFPDRGVKGSLLIDGFGAAWWRLITTGDTAVLRIEPFAAIRGAVRAAVEEEAEQLVAFIAGDAVKRRVELARR
jgi:hypothetical protein